MVVTVTLNDILTGNTTPHGNPIALALQRQTQDSHVRVEYAPFQEGQTTRHYRAAIFPRTTSEHRVLLPSEAVVFLSAFENNEPTSPLEFELDYTYRTAGQEFLHKMAMKRLQKKNLSS